MVQVVAALNPIAGERMQEELEQRIFALQSELERAHSEVRTAALLACAPFVLMSAMSSTSL